MSPDEALEKAAAMLERRAGNEVYQKAWKIAARLIREMKSSAEKVNVKVEENA